MTHSFLRPLLGFGALLLFTLAPIAAAAQAPEPGTWYRLQTQFRGDGECLEGNQADGQAMNGTAFMDDCSGATGQLWQVVDAGGGYYHLKTQFRGDGECLESNARDGGAKGGASFMTPCRNQTGQRWQFVDLGNGYFHLKSQGRGAGECLEGNQRGGQAMGGSAFMDDCSGAVGQQWRFVAQGSNATASNETGSTDSGTIVIDGTEVQTGALQVTLQWDSRADLDLYVTDPSGNTVSYQNTSVASGGMLDVDARSGCSATEETVENILWSDTPPSGAFSIMVDYYEACDEGAVPYTLTLRRNGQVVDTWTGTLTFGNSESHTYTAM